MKIESRKERGGEGEEMDSGRRRRERQKRRKEKGEDERGKEKGEVSHDVLEASTTSSGWAQQAPEHSRIGNTKCMNWRESNGDQCKMVRSVQCTKC